MNSSQNVHREQHQMIVDLKLAAESVKKIQKQNAYNTQTFRTKRYSKINSIYIPRKKNINDIH